MTKRKREQSPDMFREMEKDSDQTEDEYIFSDGDDDFAQAGLVPHITIKVDINQLRADHKQPRRAVPLSIRKGWDGNAQDVPGLLSRWHVTAEDEIEQVIPLDNIFGGEDSEIDTDEVTQPIAYKFMKLVNLANGIRRVGLNSPIGINRVGTGGLISYGERRWLAYHMLMLHVDPNEYSMIPADNVEGDVWRQAQENGNRLNLNAIETSRQFALLLMDIYEGTDGVHFGSFETLVSPGGCDRPFYAQVANGKHYPVNKKDGDRIIEATGLTHRRQFHRIRDLLNLLDHQWDKADEGNWKEGRCRRVLHPDQFIAKSDELSPNGDRNQDDDTPDQSEVETPQTGELAVGESYSQSWVDDYEQSMPTIPDDHPETAFESWKHEMQRDDNPTYPKSDTPPPTKESAEPESDDTDQGERVAFITYYARLERLLNTFQTLGINLNMMKQCQILRGVTLWAPETVKSKVDKHGPESITREIEEFQQALDDIFDGFKNEWEEMKRDIMDSAENAEKL